MSVLRFTALGSKPAEMMTLDEAEPWRCGTPKNPGDFACEKHVFTNISIWRKYMGIFRDSWCCQTWNDEILEIHQYKAGMSSTYCPPSNQHRPCQLWEVTFLQTGRFSGSMQFLRGWRILPEIVSKTSKTVCIPKVSEMQQRWWSKQNRIGLKQKWW